MKKTKGMTLVEVIVAIALLGIISTGFLGVFGSNLNFININKQNTEDIFVTQRQMELAIETAKNDSGLTYTTLNNVFEAGISVKVHQMSHTNGNDTFYTLISDTRLPELKVPVVESVTATLRSNTTPVTSAYAIASTNVQGNFVMDPTTMDVFMVNTFQWYVSRNGFNLPVPASYPEIEAGTKYPMFPDDYTIIPGATGTNLNNVTAYAGKHLVFAVSPAANSGKIGVTVPSKPVFISGLPVVTSDLVLHLDGTQIDETDTTQVTSGKVLKWNDLSTFNRPATQATDANRPNLVDQGIAGEFIGKQVDFASGKTLNVAHTHLNAQTLHVFAVVKGDAAGNFMVNGGQSIPTTGDAIGNGWVLSYTTYTANSNTITLGNTDVDIAELLIYRGALTAEQIEAIQKYLKEKYVPIDMIGEIVSLYNFTVEVEKDAPYSAPSAVKADMAFGNDRFVPVTWVGGAVVDTSTVGDVLVQGSAISDPTKTVTHTVRVKPPIAVTGVTVYPTSAALYVNGVMTLIEAVSPDDAANKAVVWSSSNPTVASVSSTGIVTANAVGTATITVTTVDGGRTATSLITVNALSSFPAGLVLHLDATDGLTVDGSNRVSQWNDLSGQDNHFVQSTNNYKPVLVQNVLNGLPTVSFDGSNDFMTANKNELSGFDFSVNSSNRYSIFIITRATSNRSGIIGQFSNTRPVFAFWRNSVSEFESILNNNYGNAVSANTSFGLHTSTWNGSQYRYWLNRGTVNSRTVSTQNYTNLEDIEIGRVVGNSENNLDGDIAEILIFSRELTSTEITDIESYLYKKWLATPVVEWNFNTNAQGWTAENNVSGFGWQSGGYIGGTVTGGDPYIHSNNNINIQRSSVNRIVIRMRNNTASNTGQIYFKPASADWSESFRVNFTIIPNSTEYINYEVEIPPEVTWSGQLKMLRIDPSVVVTSGSFSIDFVKIYSE